MQRKKLSIVSVSEQSPKFCCLKYSLMACNAFGIMLGIFVVLFGISYPEEDFPGGYSGKTTAGISGVFIFFTGIGYCGAHHHKAYFLILYSFIIILFLGGNIAVSVFSPEQTLFDPTTKKFYVIACVMLLVMGLAFFLAWQVKNEDRIPNRNEDKNQRSLSLNSNSNEPSSQISSQTNQQQQNETSQPQPQQQSQSQQQQQQQQRQIITQQIHPMYQNTQQQLSLAAHFQNDQMVNLNNRSVSALGISSKLPNGHQMSNLNQSIVQINNNDPNAKNLNSSNSNFMMTNNNQMNKNNLQSLTPGSYLQISVPPRYNQNAFS